MEKKLSKIIGLKKEDFDSLVQNGQIKLRKARLIPINKVGDEMALTSVLLSSMKLIKEFRRIIQSDLKMMKGGQLHVYTEVELPGFPDSRVDGLIIVVQSGVIKDATILEMKNGASRLEVPQIEKYLEIAKKFTIPRLVTVSNEFVSNPSQFPIEIKKNRGVDLYHFSWSYLLTISHLLLFENNMNIEDEDQIEIMKEVLDFFEYEKSGVCGFSQMKQGWSKTIESINSGTLLRNSDDDVRDAVLSWQQEERDLALMMSRKLGVLVKSGESKYKGNYQKRFDDDAKELITNKKLHSVYQIEGAVSSIKVHGLFVRRAVAMAVTLKTPTDLTLRGQIGWIKKQFDACERKAKDGFLKLSYEVFVEVYMKNTSNPVRVSYSDLDQLIEELKGKELRECKIIQLKDFGKMFASRTKFVDTIESMIVNFYSGVIQHLKKWDAPAPKLATVDEAQSEQSENVIGGYCGEDTVVRNEIMAASALSSKGEDGST